MRVRPLKRIAEPKNTTTPYSPRFWQVVVFSTEDAFKYIGHDCGLSEDEIRALVEAHGEPENEWLDVDSLPPCPLSTAPADLEALDLDSSGRKRCVATN